VIDLLRDAKLPPVAVTITRGETVTMGDQGWAFRAPKCDLAGVAQVLIESWRPRIVEGLPFADTLRSELANFKAKISLSGHDSFGAGADCRDGNHDDCVLAVALACWYGERDEGSLEPLPAAVVTELGMYFGGGGITG
jgi:hypothetical protein